MAAGTLWRTPEYRHRNGAHPLIRSFLDGSADIAEVQLASAKENVWRNTLAKKASWHFLRTRKYQAIRRTLRKCGRGGDAQAYCRYFGEHQYGRIRTGCDVLFEHTTAPVNIDQPFILHFESFPTLMHPLRLTGQPGGSDIDKGGIRAVLEEVFGNSNCRLVFSHIQSSIDIFKRVFQDRPDIAQKARFVPLGMTPPSMPEEEVDAKFKSGQPTRILFTNSHHNQAASFYLRGGHLLLAAVERLLRDGLDIELTIVSAKPPDIAERFDASLLERITWYDSFVPDAQFAALKAAAHVFALPAVGLHSRSLLEAVQSYSVPLISDALGYEQYVDPGNEFWQMTGVRERFYRDEPQGWISENYTGYDRHDEAFVAQIETFLRRASCPSNLKPVCLKNARYLREQVTLAASQERLASAIAQALGRGGDVEVPVGEALAGEPVTAVP